MLQKERDFAKEAKQNSEELKSELYTLRNQKSELSGKILEMQSTISSLQEEHKAIESALEEKQNPIDLMKEREKQVNEQNSRGSYLAKVLNLKEAEFEDLKSNLELPVKDWDINFRYPYSPMNFTTRVGIARRDKTMSTSKENGGRLHNYTKTADGGNLINGEDGRETENVAASRKISGKPKMLRSSQQGFQHKNTTDEDYGEQISYKISKDRGSLDIDIQKTNTNGTDASMNSLVDSEKPKGVDGATLTANIKFENNGQEKTVAGITREKRFLKNDRDGKQKERHEEAELLKLSKEKGQSPGRIASNEKDKKFKLFNPVLWKEGKESKGNTRVGSESKTKKDHSSGVLKSNMNGENRIFERFSQSTDKVQVNRNVNDKGSRVTSDDRKKKPKGIVHREAQTNGNPHRVERSGNDKAANPKKRNSADKNADTAKWEVDGNHEPDAHKLAVEL